MKALGETISDLEGTITGARKTGERPQAHLRRTGHSLKLPDLLAPVIVRHTLIATGSQGLLTEEELAAKKARILAT